MTTPTGYARIDVGRDRATEQLSLNSWGFAMDVPEEHRDHFAQVFPWDRGRGVEVVDSSQGRVGDLVGVHTSHGLTMRVPGGGEVPVAGLSWVSVHPGHRRKGVLRAMIADHFSRSLARGEVLSALYAAETQIYQRFGYGCAGWASRVDLGRAPALREVSGASSLRVHIHDADPATDPTIVRAVQQRLVRPGSIVQGAEAVVAEDFTDIPQWRGGHEQLRFLWVEDERGPAAFAVFSRGLKWEQGVALGEVSVRSWGAATPASLHRLVSVVSDLDLMAHCYLDRVTADSPLFQLFKDPRALQPRGADNIWVRILDLPAALQVRGYDADCDVVVEVADPVLARNAGRWRISITEGAARVTTAVDSPPDLEVGIQELSAAYLGGVSLLSAASAGAIREYTTGSVQRLSRAFRASHDAVSNLAF